MIPIQVSMLDLQALSPALIMAGFGLLVLILDAVQGRGSRGYLAYVTVVGFVAAAGAAYLLWQNDDPRPLFSNTFSRSLYVNKKVKKIPSAPAANVSASIVPSAPNDGVLVRYSTDATAPVAAAVTSWPARCVEPPTIDMYSHAAITHAASTTNANAHVGARKITANSAGIPITAVTSRGNRSDFFLGASAASGLGSSTASSVMIVRGVVELGAAPPARGAAVLSYHGRRVHRPACLGQGNRILGSAQTRSRLPP